MRVLYIDTSSSYLYTGIVENGRIIEELKEDFSHELSKYALPKIVSMFEEKNLSAKDIDKIIVVNGPGSFTGIRIGITIAKVYAWSLNIAITTISALAAMAISSLENKIHVPMINARRGYVFAAIYDENYKELLESKQELLGQIRQDFEEKETDTDKDEQKVKTLEVKAVSQTSKDLASLRDIRKSLVGEEKKEKPHRKIKR